MKYTLIIALLILIVAAAPRKDSGPRRMRLEYPAYFGNRIDTAEDNPVTVEGVALGRRLFYETALSANGKISCASCHRQALAFADDKKFSSGFDGTPTERNAMSLANLLWLRNFFWDGRARGLEEQAQTPMTHPHEMGQALCVSAEKLQGIKPYRSLFKTAFGSDKISGERICMAIAQFERTLISANSRYDQYLRGEYRPTGPESRGMELFFANPDPAAGIRGAACGHCHGGPKTFNELYHNNGLDSIPADPGRETITAQRYDRGRFRVVTLRNIALTAPYMHDGRFATLGEVVDQYSEHIRNSETLSPFLQKGGMGLTSREKQDIIAFLHMLTDSSFIADKRFSNPFIQ